MKLFRADIILLLLLVSCKNKADEIKGADRIEINTTENGRVVRVYDSSQKVIGYFEKVLKGNPEKTKCIPSGSIAFYKKGSLIALYGFVIIADDRECLYLLEPGKGWRLTYNAGMYLDEKLSELKKKL